MLQGGDGRRRPADARHPLAASAKAARGRGAPGGGDRAVPLRRTASDGALAGRGGGEDPPPAAPAPAAPAQAPEDPPARAGRGTVAEDQERIRRKIRANRPPDPEDPNARVGVDAPGAAAREVLRAHSRRIEGKIAAEKIHRERMRGRRSRRRRRSTEGGSSGAPGPGPVVVCSSDSDVSSLSSLQGKIVRTTQRILRQQGQGTSAATGGGIERVVEGDETDLLRASARRRRSSTSFFGHRAENDDDGADAKRRKWTGAGIAFVVLALVAGGVSGIVLATRREVVRCGRGRARRALLRSGPRRPPRRLSLRGDLHDKASPGLAPAADVGAADDDDGDDEDGEGRRPTSYPTMGADLRVIKGSTWYDRDADGRRSPGVRAEGMMRDDVEFPHVVEDVERGYVVGGVRVALVPCDGDTGRSEVSAKKIDGFFTLAAHGNEGVIPRKGNNGQFGFYLEQIDRYYYIQATAPEGYLLTSGVCNDDEFGWECEYPNARADTGVGETFEGLPPDIPIGIKTGRSSTCTYAGYQEGSVQKPLHFGVMRESDNDVLRTSAVLVLAFDDDGGARALGAAEEAAIGIVTAEVLALALDVGLAREFEGTGLQLNSVVPKEVFLPGEDGTADVGGAGNGIAVVVGITALVPNAKTTDPDSDTTNDPTTAAENVARDFEGIVQDSINRDSTKIQNDLTEYNRNCQEQTSKVKDEGMREEDFGVVASTSGVARPGLDRLEGDVFSTACSDELALPNFFESLADIEVTSIEEVDDLKCGI